MSFIGSALSGINSLTGPGAQPTNANLIQPTTADQANQGYYQSQEALQKQQELLAALQGQNGLQNQSDIYKQLQQIASGQGPNPAQAALNQNTAQNIAQQGALMGSQRGVGANPGLLARQVGMQGGNIQQQAAGQAATLQAQQAMNAINAAGNIANTQAGNQLNTTQNYNQNMQNNRGLTLQGIQGQNANNVQMQGGLNSINAQQAEQNKAFNQQVLGGAFSGGGSYASSLMGGGGGGGAASGGGGSAMAGEGLGSAAMLAANGGEVGGPKSMYARQYMAEGGQTGTMPVIVSPGEVYVKPQDVSKVGSGQTKATAVGERIPGKAKVPGDSLKNDTVPRELEKGGVVIPRSVMNSKDPAKSAAAFVAKYMAKGGMVGKKAKK